MFGYRPSRFGGGDPWFRIGTLDIGSSGIVAMMTIIGMVIYAVEGINHSLSRQLVFISSDVLGGQVWRLFTWFVPEQPSLWVVLSAAIIFLLGGQLESVIGRQRMVTFLGVLILTPSVGGALLDLLGVPGTPFGLNGGSLVASSIFFAYIAYMPRAQFFFGIQGWVIGAVFAFVELLSLIADRNTALLLLLFIRIGGALITARSFGLADDLPWIPDARSLVGGRGGGSASSRRSGGGSRRSRSSAPLSVVNDSRFEDLNIDAILDQVSEHGVDSLTSEQKKKLKAYSKDRKKNR